MQLDHDALVAGQRYNIQMRHVENTGGASAFGLLFVSMFIGLATGMAGAPKLGDAAAWAPRIKTGTDSLVQSVLKGKGAMPPKIAPTVNWPSAPMFQTLAM